MSRLRLTHTQTVLAVAGTLLVITNLYLGMSYLAGQAEKARLVGQYQARERSLEQLKAAQDAVPAGPESTPAFPKSVPGIELTGLVIQAARDTGTEVITLNTSAVGAEQIGSGTYRVVRIALRLRADPSRLAAFFEQMERGAVPTMVFDNVSVIRNGDAWEASLDLLAYAQGT